jgi:hypothetical protein
MLASTENQILTARTRFNETVRPYNNHIKIFPNPFLLVCLDLKTILWSCRRCWNTCWSTILNTIPFRLRERHKKLRFLLKKGFYLRTLSDRINDAIFSNYSDFKNYAVHEVSEKKQNKQKINLCQQKLFLTKKKNNKLLMLFAWPKKYLWEIRVHLENNRVRHIWSCSRSFHELKMDETELKNGVLIYLAVKIKHLWFAGIEGLMLLQTTLGQYQRCYAGSF